MAVKTLTSRDPEVIKKFNEEANLMMKFSHPNIVSLLGIDPCVHKITITMQAFAKKLVGIYEANVCVYLNIASELKTQLTI